MQNQSEFSAFISAWSFTRGLSVDLLKGLREEDLLWAPGPELGCFWKQFRHIGRVQEDYTQALKTKKVKFSCEGKGYSGGADTQALITYLKELDENLLEVLDGIKADDQIDWFGESVSASEHLARLAGHETLHHGQWIVYCQLRGAKYPESWAVWGL